MEMSGAAKLNAGGIFPESNSAPSQGQVYVHQELQPEGVTGRRSGSAPHVAAGGGLGVSMAWLRPPGAAAPDAVSWGASSRCGNSAGPRPPTRATRRRGSPPTEPGLRLGLTWRCVFLSGNSSSVDLHLAKQSILA